MHSSCLGLYLRGQIKYNKDLIPYVDPPSPAEPIYLANFMARVMADSVDWRKGRKKKVWKMIYAFMEPLCVSPASDTELEPEELSYAGLPDHRDRLLCERYNSDPQGCPLASPGESNWSLLR